MYFLKKKKIWECSLKRFNEAKNPYPKRRVVACGSDHHHLHHHKIWNWKGAALVADSDMIYYYTFDWSTVIHPLCEISELCWWWLLLLWLLLALSILLHRMVTKCGKILLSSSGGKGTLMLPCIAMNLLKVYHTLFSFSDFSSLREILC